MMEDGVIEDVKKLNSEARKESEEEESRGNSSGVKTLLYKSRVSYFTHIGPLEVATEK